MRLRRLIAAAAAAILGLVALVFAIASPTALGSASRAEYGGGGPLDLAVSITATPAQLAPGGQAVFRIRVDDLSKTPANDLILAVTLPAGAVVNLTQADRGPGCKASTGGLTCNLDYLAGSPTTANVVLILTLPNAGDATVVATAAASQQESDMTNNSAQTTVQVGTAAPLGGTGTTTSRPAAPTVNVIHGSARADRIYGTAKSDVIEGGAGNDQLYGGAGNDRIVGGTGKDWLYGGPGNDTIYAKDKAKDHVFCGSGKDTVYADRIDIVAKDCEKIVR